jgi:hypothetical protein
MRLAFDEPQELKRIPLVFEEDEMTRTQEFVLRSFSNPDGPFERCAPAMEFWRAYVKAADRGILS